MSKHSKDVTLASVTDSEGRRYAVVPVETLNTLASLGTVAKVRRAVHDILARLPNDETAIDVAAFDIAKAEGGETFPAQVVRRVVSGENRIKVFREYRGLTQTELAAEIGSSAAYVSQLETGARHGGRKTLGKIADALELERADLDP